jgi:hypothetical protein
VPASIKLKEEYGDDVNVLFVESQNTSPEDTEAFILKMKWMGSASMWTNERPMDSGSNSLPSAVLLGSDGRELMRGAPIHQKIKEAVESDLKAQKTAPKGTPPALAAAWIDYAKGNLGAAIAKAEKLAQTPAAEDKDGLVEASKKAAAEFRGRTTKRVERVKWLVDNGQYARADAEVALLQKSLKDLPELNALVGEQATRLQSDELKTAREAEKALANLEKKLYDKGLDEKSSKALKGVAEKYNGTKAAARAIRLATLADKAVQIK